MRRWLVAGGLAVALLAGACSDTTTFDPRALGDALADQLATRYPAAIRADQATCVGDRVVAGFTEERLAELELSADSVARGTKLSDVALTESEADRVTDIHQACLDLDDVLLSELAQAGFESESAACVAAAVTDEVRTEFAASLVSGEENERRTDSVVELYRSCFTQAELATWLGVDGPVELGLAIGDSVVAAAPALVTDEAASCIGDGVVAALGVERMHQAGLTVESVASGAGVTTASLTADEIAAVADAALACVSYRQLLLDQVDRVTVDAGCVDANLTDELLRAAVIEAFTAGAGSEASDALADVYRGCLRAVLALVPPGGSLAFADIDLDAEAQRLADLIAYQVAVAGLEQPYNLVDLGAATCVSGHTVAALGVERLAALGLTETTVAEGLVPAAVALGPDDAAAFTESVYRCVDARGAFARHLVDDAPVADAVLGCLGDAVPGPILREAARASATGAPYDPSADADFQALVVELFSECVDDGSLLVLGEDPIPDPPG